MDKELLFQFMRTKFREAGFSRQEAALHITRYEERYQNKNDDEIEADIMAQGGPSKVVTRLIEQRNTVLMKDPEYRAFVDSVREEPKPAENSAAAIPEAAVPQSPAPSVRIPEADEDEDVKPYIPPKKQTAPSEPRTAPVPAEARTSDGAQDDVLSAWFSDDTKIEKENALPPLFDETPPPQKPESRTPRPSAPAPAPQKPMPQADSRTPAPDLSRTKVISVPQAIKAPQFPPAAVTDQRESIYTPAAPAPSSKKAHHTRIRQEDRGNVSRLSERTYWGEATEAGFRRFWILFAVTLPLTIAVILLILALSLGIIVSIFGLIAALIALLAAEVAIGAAISLVGIIYGVSQLFLTLPVGLFELGIGVTVMGITMFAGILIYNLAVRFLPFVLRQFYRFLRFLWRYGQDLFYYLKGECYRR